MHFSCVRFANVTYKWNKYLLSSVTYFDILSVNKLRMELNIQMCCSSTSYDAMTNQMILLFIGMCDS